MPASRRLYEGKRVLVWWTHDNCSYPATINRLSHSEVELIYEDGLRKSYRRDGSISHRISLGEVPKHVWAWACVGVWACVVGCARVRVGVFVLVVRVGARVFGLVVRVVVFVWAWACLCVRGRLFVSVVTVGHAHEWDSMLNELMWCVACSSLRP